MCTPSSYATFCQDTLIARNPERVQSTYVPSQASGAPVGEHETQMNSRSDLQDPPPHSAPVVSSQILFREGNASVPGQTASSSYHDPILRPMTGAYLLHQWEHDYSTNSALIRTCGAAPVSGANNESIQVNRAMNREVENRKGATQGSAFARLGGFVRDILGLPE